MVWVSSVLSVLAGPVYFLTSLFYFQDASKEQLIAVKIRGTHIDCKLKKEERPSREKRIWLFVLSYALFGLCLGLPLGCMYLLLFKLTSETVRYQFRVMTTEQPLGLAEIWEMLLKLLVASIISISNALFYNFVGCITEIEKHSTWSAYRWHRLLKLYVFRFTNVYLMFFWTYYAELPWYTCMVTRMALQSLIFVISDFLVTTIINLLIPFFYQGFCNVWTCRPLLHTGEDTMHQIELSDEIMRVVFRQFVMYAAVPVFPFVTVLTLLCNVAELPVNKFRMTRLSLPPQGLVGGRRQLCVGLMLASLLSFFVFPLGAFWFAPGVSESSAGPRLCWPCVEYSRVEGESSGNVCGSEFEPTVCEPPKWASEVEEGGVMAKGGQVSVYEIRQHLRVLLRAGRQDGQAQANGTLASEEYRSSLAFFDARSWLFKSRRCACRPCVQTLSCGCSEPLNQRVCESFPPYTCAHNTSTSVTSGLKNYGKECWQRCGSGLMGTGGQGQCAWCGTGHCCRYGWTGVTR